MKSPLEHRTEALDRYIKEHGPSPAVQAIAQGEAAGVVLKRGSDLSPQPISWLWKGWIAKGKLHILAGMPGQGKTTIAMAVAAAITVGGRLPDGSICSVGNVVVFSGEDDPEDGLLPKLIAAGADPRRIFFVSGTSVAGEIEPFDPARDVPNLAQKIAEIGEVALLVVDPVVGVVSGDSHSNTDVRRGLQTLVDLAASTGVAVLGISHFSKGGQGQDPALRVVGSVAFAAVARVVLVAAKVRGDDGESRRILARGKSNIGPDDGGFEYHLEQVDLDGGLEATKVAWGSPVQGTARELLTESSGDDTGASALDEAKEFLRQVLGEDTVPAPTIKQEALSAGHSWATVRRASEEMAVIKRKGGMDKGWYWSLPKLPADRSVSEGQR